MVSVCWKHSMRRLNYVHLCARWQSTLSKEARVQGSQVAKPVFHRADQWDKRKNIAMIDEHGTHTYGELSVKSRLVANALENELGSSGDRHQKVSQHNHE